MKAVPGQAQNDRKLVAALDGARQHLSELGDQIAHLMAERDLLEAFVESVSWDEIDEPWQAAQKLLRRLKRKREEA